jgi:hypothetical protein
MADTLPSPGRVRQPDKALNTYAQGGEDTCLYVGNDVSVSLIGNRADHGKLKQLIRPVRGFKTLKTAYATIKGFEVMRALRKNQAAIFNITGDIRGEVHLVERAFGLGASALAEAVQFVSKRLALETA